MKTTDTITPEQMQEIERTNPMLADEIRTRTAPEKKEYSLCGNTKSDDSTRITVGGWPV